jgi:hypothetical protein
MVTLVQAIIIIIMFVIVRTVRILLDLVQGGLNQCLALDDLTASRQSDQLRPIVSSSSTNSSRSSSIGHRPRRGLAWWWWWWWRSLLSLSPPPPWLCRGSCATLWWTRRDCCNERMVTARRYTNSTIIIIIIITTTGLLCQTIHHHQRRCHVCGSRHRRRRLWLDRPRLEPSSAGYTNWCDWTLKRHGHSCRSCLCGCCGQDHDPQQHGRRTTMFVHGPANSSIVN